MELSDDEIIMIIRMKNEEALNMLLFRYQKYSISLISSMYHKIRYLGLFFEELRANLDLTIVKAVESYDFRRAIFYSYWRQIAERELISLCRKSYYKKNRCQKAIYSLDSPIKDTEDCYFVDTISDENENIIEQYHHRESLLKVKDSIDNDLSVYEKTILSYRVLGYSYKEIAKITKKTAKDIDNALMLMRKKIQKKQEE